MTAIVERNRTAARFILQRYPDAGVVADLQTGNIYRVNATAALICDAVLGAQDPERTISAALSISEDEARELIQGVMDGLSASPVRGQVAGAYHFVSTGSGYAIQDGADPVLTIDEAGETVKRIPGAGLPSRLDFYVRALAPKLLFRRGVTVLHASCCASGDGGLVAFAGLSGAGKTTTARAFATAGLRLISEDLVVLSGAGPRPQVAVGAEHAIHRWAHELATALEHSPTGVPVGDLTTVTEGPSAPLAEVLFVDRDRRRGDTFAAAALSQPDALVALLPHDFLGADESDSWRRYFTRAAALVASVPMFELWCPDSVDKLATAAGRYMTNRAS